VLADAVTRSYANQNTANRWLQVRLEMMGNFTVLLLSSLLLSSLELSDTHVYEPYVNQNTANRWLQVRLEMMGNATVRPRAKRKHLAAVPRRARI